MDHLPELESKTIALESVKGKKAVKTKKEMKAPPPLAFEEERKEQFIHLLEQYLLVLNHGGTKEEEQIVKEKLQEVGAPLFQDKEGLKGKEEEEEVLEM